MAIEIPIKASDIRDEFSYFLTDNPNEAPIDVFQISDYYGMPLYYPNGRRRPDGTPILTPSGEIQFSRVLPNSGTIKFSDFLGAVGYFAEYPEPVVTIAPAAGVYEGYSNYTLITMDVVIDVDSRNSEVVDWRPDISRREIIVEWQELNTGNYQWETRKSTTYTNVGRAADSITLPTRPENDYYFRVKATAISYALNDDLVPYGGDLGAIREVARTVKNSETIRLIYTPYDPAEPAIVKSALAVWNDYKTDDGDGVGTFEVTRYAFDGSHPIQPDPTLRWQSTNANPNKLGLRVTYDPAYGRSAQNITRYEWEYYDPRLDDKHPELTVGDLGWRSIDDPEYPLDPYPDNVEYGTTGNHSIMWSSVIDLDLDQLEFRLKCTATQTLYDPYEVRVVEEYSDHYLINVDLLLLQPTYTLNALNTAVVNGGTFRKNLAVTNMPNHRYYWEVVPRSGSEGTPNSSDFLSNTGDFGVEMAGVGANAGDSDFNIITILDSDTDTESFDLKIYTDVITETSTPVVTQRLDIVYGEPEYFITINTGTDGVYLIDGHPIDGQPVYGTNEDSVFQTYVTIKNLGDKEYQWRYSRTYAGDDNTPQNDFKYSGSSTLLSVNTLRDRQTQVYSYYNGAIWANDEWWMRAEKDSPFGGDVNNFEEFKVELVVDGTVRDWYYLRVFDKTEYRVDAIGDPVGFSSQWTWTGHIDGGSVTADAPTKSIGYTLTGSGAPAHVSWHTHGEGTLYYRWVVHNPAFTNGPAYWRPSLSKWYYATGGLTGSAGDGWAVVGSNPNRIIGTYNYDQKIVDKGFNNLEFSKWDDDWRSDLSRNIGDVKWGLQFLAVAADGTTKVEWSNNEARVLITQSDVYIQTGITGAGGGRYKEGRDMQLIVKLRTSRMIGRKVRIMLDEGGPGGYRLIGWPQFGPQHPDYSHPVMEKEVTVTANYMPVNMGAPFTVYNYRESYQNQAGLGMNNVYIRARAYIAPNQYGFNYDSENYEKSGEHRVLDTDGAFVMHTTKRLGNSPPVLHAPNKNNPVGRWKMDVYFTATNPTDRGTYGGNGGNLPAGAGWYFRRATGEPEFDELGNSNNPEDWFYPYSVRQMAEEAGVEAGILNDISLVYHTYSFNIEGSPTGDIFDYSRSLRNGKYRAGSAENPAAEMTILNPTISASKPNGKWFPTKQFTLVGQSWGCGDPRLLTVFVKSRQPKPPTWRIVFDTIGNQTPPGSITITWTIQDQETWQVIPDSELMKHYDEDDFWGDIQLRSNLNSTGVQERGLLRFFDGTTKATGNFYSVRSATIYFTDAAANITEDGTGGVYAYYPAGTLGGKGRRLFTIKKAYEDIVITLPDVYKTQGNPDDLIQGIRAPVTASVEGGKEDSVWTYTWSLTKEIGQASISANGSSATVTGIQCAKGKINLTVRDQHGLEESASSSYELWTIGECVDYGGPAYPMTVTDATAGGSNYTLIGATQGTPNTEISVSASIGISGGSGSYKVDWTTTKSGAGTRSGTAGSGRTLTAKMYLLNVREGIFEGTITGTATVTDRETGEVKTATVTLLYTWTVEVEQADVWDDAGTGPGDCGAGFIWSPVLKRCVVDTTYTDTGGDTTGGSTGGGSTGGGSTGGGSTGGDTTGGDTTGGDTGLDAYGCVIGEEYYDFIRKRCRPIYDNTGPGPDNGFDFDLQ